ncbi:hypothetical protein MK805_16730 [Shimazuella sp. AN120528]|uniref:hypothetical protein n=1 Tax=Shimazuella soli TaxID=1892854 RepID=UPI001F10019A|nr:hypothetical protein [Shimazuella soli]MCH5586586.1 hypothetical protein [Shimazuella soli]
MYFGRDLEELSTIPMKNWEIDELSYHHYMLSQMSPLMNEQGVNLHHQVIDEIMKRSNQTRP